MARNEVTAPVVALLLLTVNLNQCQSRRAGDANSRALVKYDVISAFGALMTLCECFELSFIEKNVPPKRATSKIGQS